MTTNFEYYQNENSTASSAEINSETKERIERFKQQKLGKLALHNTL